MRRPVLERNNSLKENEKKDKTSPGLLSKHLKRIYPIGLQKSNSSLSLSSLSLSLSENSNDSSLADFGSPLDHKISLALRLVAPPGRKESPAPKNVQQQQSQDANNPEELRRCNWITKNSGKCFYYFWYSSNNFVSNKNSQRCFSSISVLCKPNTILLTKYSTETKKSIAVWKEIVWVVI